MQDLNVVIVQSQQFWEDKESNLRHFEQHLTTVKPGSANLILLPEMFNTGFSMHTGKLAEKMDGPSIKWLINQAQLLDSRIGATLIIEEEGKFYNRFVVASGAGIEAYYDKRHLFRMANENEHFSPGERRVVYSLKGWNILLQVCYDLRFPVFSRNRTIDGNKEYDVVIYLANWPEKRVYAWKNLLQARAIENQAYCIGVNRVGIDGNDINYSGDSMAVDPWGHITLHCAENIETVKFLTLRKDVLDDITERFPAFLDAD